MCSPWEKWRVSAIYMPDKQRGDVLRTAVAHMVGKFNLSRVVYLHQSHGLEFGVETKSFVLRQLSSKRGVQIVEAASLLCHDSLLVLDDAQTIRRYPQSMTRNIIYHLIHRTPYKIIAGSEMVVGELSDLYSPYVVLDKRIIASNHYWAFAEDHREVSVFDGDTIVGNKDPVYLAEKLKPFTLFDLIPDNPVQESLYQAMIDIEPRQRLDSLEDLIA